MPGLHGIFLVVLKKTHVVWVIVVKMDGAGSLCVGGGNMRQKIYIKTLKWLFKWLFAKEILSY